MERSIAYRRHQEERAKGRAKRLIGKIFRYDIQEYGRLIQSYQRDRTPCSCKMCRNPRWIEGDSHAERRQKLNASCEELV